jgi:hypothetical protein
MILPSATKKYENETILNFRQFAVCDPDAWCTWGWDKAPQDKLSKLPTSSYKTRLKILPVLTREHYTSLLHWV